MPATEETSKAAEEQDRPGAPAKPSKPLEGKPVQASGNDAARMSHDQRGVATLLSPLHMVQTMTDSQAVWGIMSAYAAFIILTTWITESMKFQEPTQ